MEVKVVVYLLMLTAIYRIIVEQQFRKSSYNWNGFLDHTDIGSFWTLIRLLWAVYLVGRWVLYPFTIWWFQ